MATRRHYHFYEIPEAGQEARRRNIPPVQSANESRRVRDWYNKMGLPTAVYCSQSPKSPDPLPFGERLWT